MYFLLIQKQMNCFCNDNKMGNNLVIDKDTSFVDQQLLVILM